MVFLAPFTLVLIWSWNQKFLESTTGDMNHTNFTDVETEAQKNEVTYLGNDQKRLPRA